MTSVTIDALVGILANGPLRPSKIMRQPAWGDWSERILVNTLRDAEREGLVKRDYRRGTYELVPVDYTVGADLGTARQTLAAVADEVKRRNADDTPARPLYLTVTDLGAVLADTVCSALLEQVLKFGRKVGVTGVAYAGSVPASHPVIRGLLETGRPLAHSTR